MLITEHAWTVNDRMVREINLKSSRQLLLKLLNRNDKQNIISLLCAQHLQNIFYTTYPKVPLWSFSSYFTSVFLDTRVKPKMHKYKMEKKCCVSFLIWKIFIYRSCVQYIWINFPLFLKHVVCWNIHQEGALKVILFSPNCSFGIML